MKRFLIVDDIKGWRDYNSNIMQELFPAEEIEIDTAESAARAYDYLLEGKPYYAIITDLQMEDDYAPKHAGEWLVEQIKTFSRYNSTKVVMISATYNIKHIAETLGVSCIPKSTALKCFSAYEELLSDENKNIH